MPMPRINVLSDYEIRGLGRAVARYDGCKNLSIVALSAPGKPADLGQFSEQPDTPENLEIRNLLSSRDANEGLMYDDVHVTPAYMEFKDASEGVIFEQLLTIRNMGKLPAVVRIGVPNSITVKIKSLDKRIMLNPGLALKRKVTYSFKRPALLHATIPIDINAHLIYYHIVCSQSTEFIMIEPRSIDFGIVDIGCSSETKLITISNVGGKSTRFTVDLGKNDMEINVKPYRGIVPPHGKVRLHVEMIGITEGTFYSEFWIKSVPDIGISVKVNVIIPRLLIYYPNTTGDFTLVDFSPTFVKTQRYDTLVLRNVSSQFSSFVVLGEINDELVPIKDIDTNVHLAYSVFKITPIEGRLEPFEGIIFDIEFSPTLDVVRKLNNGKHPVNQDLMAFVRILRVHSREAEDIIRPDVLTEPTADFPQKEKVRIHEDAQSNSTDEVEESVSSVDQMNVETVRLCIHGEVETAELHFVPDELYFDNFESCGVEERVVAITNPSKNSSVIFRFVPNGSVHCEPPEGSLPPGKSQEVLIRVGGKHILYVDPIIKLGFDVIAKTNSSDKSRKLMNVKVATFHVNCYVKCSTMKTAKAPIKFALGLTPILTNPTGLNTELASFGSNVQKPRNTMFMVEKDPKRIWANKRLIKSGKISDSVPAFPNDTQQSSRPQQGQTIRSIFTGTIRYSQPPDLSLTFSDTEIARRKKEREYWSNYLRTLQRYKEKKVESKRLQFLRDGHEELDEICIDLREILCQNETFDSLFNLNKINVRTKAKLTKKQETEKTLVPLSPLQIYNIKISPTMFTFGSVVMKSKNFQELLIENKNNFPVMIRLISLRPKNISFEKGNLIMLGGGTSVKKRVKFWADQIGKYNSYIVYVINDNHTFELMITADVVYKFLTLGARELILGGDEYLPEECYRPLAGYIKVKNKLNAGTNFTWDVPASASYVIDPLVGRVRGNRNLFVSITYEPDIVKIQNTELIIATEGGTYMTLKLNTLITPVPEVAFLNDTLNVGPIPLNVPHTVVAVLHNAEYNQVIFKVEEMTARSACEVHPRRGIIEPRGIALIEIVLRFEVCADFTITVNVTVEKSHNLGVKVTGRVMCPSLKFDPEKIVMRRISADAFQVHHLTVTNVGKTLATLRFPLKDYPEFHVSLSVDQHGLEILEEGMIVLPATTRSFYLHFTPVDLASYAFYLPMIINEILGPVIMENPKSLKVQEYLTANEKWFIGLDNINIVTSTQTLPTIFIDCTVAGHVISFSKLFFKFDTSIHEVEDTLRISNSTKKDISFIIRIDKLKQKKCPFTIEWERGTKVEFEKVAITCTLKPGSNTHLKLKFVPTLQGDYLCEAPIFVRGELDGGMFNRLRLEGKDPRGFIESNTLEIYLCPIPLKVECEEKFEICTSYFSKNSNILAKIMEPDKLIGEFKRDLLTVTFPHGNHVEAHGKRRTTMQVSLTFRSPDPISFRTKIHFSDTENHSKLFVTVFATADNCLMTNHAFAMSSGGGLRINKFDFQGSSYYTLHSEVSENCSFEEQDSAGNQRKFTEANPRMSTHSNTSQSSWNTTKLFNSMKMKACQTFRESSKTVEEDEQELVVASLLEVSKESIGSPHAPKSHRTSKLSYPFLPNYTNSSVYEQHMLRTMKAAERWLYFCPLKYQFYPRVPDGITAVLSNLCMVKMKHSDKKKCHTVDQSFIDVLVAIVGRQVYDFIGTPSSLPEDDLERIALVLKIYENMLNFLVAQGAFLCHVSAHYLLNYSDYLITLDGPKLLRPPSKTWLGNELPLSDGMPLYIFDAWSKQCWLDVILQTFNTFVLRRITTDGLKMRLISDSMVFIPFDITNPASTVSFLNPLSDSLISNMEHQARANDNYPKQESLLLAWLEKHYEQQRREDWLMDVDVVLNPLEEKDASKQWKQRVITNFEDDLADGIVLIAVTGAYCPFLIEESFRNIYLHPKRPEEVLHNAICVVTAWQKIRLGFIITPHEIVRPNSVQMLMLVVHLFETLPTYLPRTIIKLSCPLTEMTTRVLNLTNPSDFRVSYVIQFFGNKSDFFNTDQTGNIFSLNKRDNGSIRIQFHARKIQKTRAYLVLCSGTIGPIFAKNQCFILEGAASYLRVTNEYKIKSKLYKIVDKTLSIQVPYKYATEYKIWMTEEIPTKPATIKMEKWSKLRLRKIPRRLFLNQKSLKVLEDAHKADLSISVGCISPQVRNFWLIFQSKLGDFIIQIISSSQTSMIEKITVEWEPEGCICPDPSTSIVNTCPSNISIPIPTRNAQLWNLVSQMFQKSLNPKEKLFWSRHLETNIGLRLIHCLMGDHTDAAAQECMHLFESSVTYTVSTSDKSNLLIVPENFTISDVRSTVNHIEMKIHVDEATPQVYETTLSLVSLDKRENRLYNIKLLC